MKSKGIARTATAPSTLSFRAFRSRVSGENVRRNLLFKPCGSDTEPALSGVEGNLVRAGVYYTYDRGSDVDTFTTNERSRIMRAVHSTGTTPERKCESLLRSLKLSFSRHPANLLGRPDFLLAKHRLAVFVHGCFWHAHARCKNSALPTSNVDYWVKKIDRNRRRDRRVRDELRRAGWRTAVIWECKLRNLDSVARRLLKLTSGEKLR